MAPERPLWTRTCHFVVTASPFLYSPLAFNPSSLVSGVGRHDQLLSAAFLHGHIWSHPGL